MPYGFASRPRRLRAPFLALALAVVCLPAAGCGDNSGNGRLLSRQQAGDLRASLNRIEQDVAAEDCTGAGQEVSGLQDRVDSIRRLNRELRSSLRSSVRRLESLVSDKCDTTTTTTTPTETTPTTPDTGSSGATGATGEEGTKKEKKPKKEKPPKDETTPPEGDGQTPPGQQDGGGGAGVPGESIPNGNGG
jgi:hypothetical protein